MIIDGSSSSSTRAYLEASIRQAEEQARRIHEAAVAAQAAAVAAEKAANQPKVVPPPQQKASSPPPLFAGNQTPDKTASQPSSLNLASQVDARPQIVQARAVPSDIPQFLPAKAPAGDLPPTAVAAFKQQFGREPASDIDGQTARALDPKTTLPKYQGHDSVITVARIQPVHGGGLVRGALYIPRKDVFNFPKHDQGDARGMKPDFAPDDARVSFYVDYENGIVIGRQNPSVTAPAPMDLPDDPSGRAIYPPPEVKVGIPKFDVVQAADGTVHLKYDAVNPFAPPGSAMAGRTANGDLYIEPSHIGGRPQVAGTVGKFPAIEIYHDSPSGARSTLLQDDVDNHGSLAPLFDLPDHHSVGDPGAESWKFLGPRLPLSGNYYQYTQIEEPYIRLGDPASPPTSRVMPDPFHSPGSDPQTA